MDVFLLCAWRARGSQEVCLSRDLETRSSHRIQHARCTRARNATAAQNEKSTKLCGWLPSQPSLSVTRMSHRSVLGPCLLRQSFSWSIRQQHTNKVRFPHVAETKDRLTQSKFFEPDHTDIQYLHMWSESEAEESGG